MEDVKMNPNNQILVLGERLTVDGYLIRLIQNMNSEDEFKWEVHSLAPDGYLTISNRSGSKVESEKIFRFLCDTPTSTMVYGRSNKIDFFVKEGAEMNIEVGKSALCA